MSESSGHNLKRRQPDRQPDLFQLGFKKLAKAEQSSSDSEILDDESADQRNEIDEPFSESQIENPDNRQSNQNETKTDIAYYINRRLSDKDQDSILNNLWTPYRSFKFPPTLFGKKNRSFQISYLDDFSWLAYSRSLDAAFCKFCFIFQRDKPGGSGSVSQSTLTSTGFKGWRKARDDFKHHALSDAHKESAIFASNFLSSYEAGNPEVLSMLNRGANKEAERNRNALIAIIRTVIFLAKHNIPFRGHRDKGRIELDNPAENDGNFRGMLRLTAANYDTSLKEFLIHSSANALPNQRGPFLSVMADETTDVSTKEQLTICIRYVHRESNKSEIEIREDFIGFVNIDDMTGEGLTKSILSKMSEVGLILFGLRGQNYDGASSMRSDLVGVKTRIQQEYPLAIYTYCSNHCLNLVLSDSCSSKYIRNMFGVIKEVTSFFSRSAKRCAIFKRILEANEEFSKYKGLISLCETRWVERHDAVIRFAALLNVIVSALETIEHTTNDRDVRSNASILSKCVCSLDFIVSLFCAVRLLSLTHPLSKSLQDPEADLSVCYNLVTTTCDVIVKLGEDINDDFSKIFNKTKDKCKELDVELKLPRISKLQAEREDLMDLYGAEVTEQNIEEYYRRTVFIVLLEDFVDSLTSRFDGHTSNVCALLKLLPPHLNKCSDTDLETIYNFYKDDLGVPFELMEAEVKIWKKKWTNTAISPTMSAIDSLRNCNSQIFPTLFTLLQILCTMPISVATAERSFSCLRRLKTYLRSTMGNERLSSLAMANVHFDIEIEAEEVLKEFKKMNRRILL